MDVSTCLADGATTTRPMRTDLEEFSNVWRICPTGMWEMPDSVRNEGRPCAQLVPTLLDGHYSRVLDKTTPRLRTLRRD